MPAAARPELESGRVYRTRDFGLWGSNPPRLAKRLVSQGVLSPLGHGLYAHLKVSRFGAVPPTAEELMRAFLDGAPYVLTGPARWNALGLGSTALFAAPLIYNTKRSGWFSWGGQSFQLRRVAFPERPSPEWFVVDLFENAAMAGVAPDALANSLKQAMQRHAFDRTRLREMAQRYGKRTTYTFIELALAQVPE